ncbi:unnamed protein product, partial [Brenthis ino]
MGAHCQFLRKCSYIQRNKTGKKITEYHCNPNKIPKINVKFASQIFSQTVGVNMGYLADKGLLPKECQDTADIIIFFDELFESMNGSFLNSSKRSGKQLLQPLTPSSLHNQIWRKAKQILKTMKFISKEGKVCVVASISNWLLTIENMECLRNKLFYEYNLKSIWCRHFNQDPLENFFGSGRSHGYRNNSPTCAGFEAAFASLLVNNLSTSYSPGSNCEEDSCHIFKSISKLFFSKSTKSDEPIEVNFRHIYDNDFIEEDNESQKENKWVKWHPKALKTRVSTVLKPDTVTKASVTSRLDKLSATRLELVQLQMETNLKQHQFLEDEHKL